MQVQINFVDIINGWSFFPGVSRPEDEVRVWLDGLHVSDGRLDEGEGRVARVVAGGARPPVLQQGVNSIDYCKLVLVQGDREER